MKTTPRSVFRALGGAFFLSVMVSAAFSPPAQAAYDWRTVRIGGGGAVTSIKAHPRVPNLFFMTTDVGNPYRWNHALQRWEGLLNAVPPSQWNQAAAGNIAIDPNDATGNILYATVGKYAPYVAGYEWINSYGPGKVIKSTDRGMTWSDTGLLIGVSANKDQTSGERIGVDPQNSSVVYVTSHADGTFRSADAGATWTKINTLNGHFVAFDVSGGTVGGATKNVFVGCSDGVYASSDGGASFTLMAGSPANVRRAAAHADGTMYVTSYTAGVHKWSGGAWTNVSPATGAFVGVDVNPSNSNQVIVSSHAWGATAHYRSNDGGATWTKFSRTPDFAEVPFSASDRFALSTFDFCWDPFASGHVWFSDWFNAYETNDVWASPVVFKARAVGHEEIVTIGTLACPPSGPNVLLSGTADLGGFDHSSLTDPPVFSMANHFPWTPQALAGNMSGAAFQETNPSFIVRVGRHGWDGTGVGGYSTDGGLSYTQWAAQTGMTGGKVAVAANSETIVWVTQSGGTYRSTDRGATWLPVASVPLSVIGGNNVFWGAATCPIAADKVNGNKFYIYYNGALYVSTDAGVTFAVANATLPAVGNTAALKVETSPGLEGDIWVSLGTSGLFHSTNSGASFTQVANVQDARLMAVGKGLTPTTPSVYAMGKVNGIEDGIFRSDDSGGYWTQIDSATHEMGNEPNSMAADRNVHGRVYIGTNGNGIFVGDIAGATPPPAPSGLAASVDDSLVTLSWNASAGATSYTVKRSLSSGGPFTTVATNLTQTVYGDYGVTNGTTYYYVVSATNGFGESGNSNQASATPTRIVEKTFNPTADATVQDGTYANTNFGTATTLIVKNDVSPWTRQSFLKFSVSNLGGRIVSARLRLYGKHNSGTSVPPISVYGVGSSTWTETGITWNTKPTLGAQLSTVNVSSTLQYYEWDVSSFVQSEIAAGNTTLSLAAVMDAVPADGQYDWFNSREAGSSAPQLVVVVAKNIFVPAADATVQDGTYANTNYGATSTLVVKKDASPWARQAFLKFDVGGVTGQITGAKLRLYGKHNSGTSAPSVSVYGTTTNTWTESGITWNTKPAFGAALSSVSVSTTARYYEWDVTSFVQSQVSAGAETLSFGAAMDTVPADGQYDWFNAREAGTDIPLLVITVAENSLMPVADAYVQDGTYANTNFGSVSTLLVKQDISSWTRQAFLKFDASGITAPIQSATLRLFGMHNSGTSAPSVSVYSVSDNTWTEAGLTWNTKPALGGGLSSVSVTTSPQYYEWDVTSFVQAQLAAGAMSLSFGMTMDAPPADGQYDWFNSREATADRPQLIISY